MKETNIQYTQTSMAGAAISATGTAPTHSSSDPAGQIERRAHGIQ